MIFLTEKTGVTEMYFGVIIFRYFKTFREPKKMIILTEKTEVTEMYFDYFYFLLFQNFP
jgi:hypothetical protein